MALLVLPATSVAVKAADSQDIQRFVQELGGAADVKVNPATGVARFVRLSPAETVAADPAARGASRAVQAEALSADFLGRHGAIFGIRDAKAELTLLGRSEDAQGGVHLTYAQHARGVPVFAAVLKTHFDGAGRLRIVNGMTVPDVELDLTPARNAAEAERVSLALVSAQGKADGLAARGSRLFVYRAGLLKGESGANHLVWQVEVGNGRDVREFVYVDAHTGKVVDQITGIHDAMFRRAYDGAFLPNVPPSYPASPFWSEGDSFPTGVTEADNMIVASKETYDLYNLAFNRDSWDGAGAIMDSIFNRGYQCPNASWNGTFISFCAGFTTDDVTGHEWSHAYTERTHGLIYAWQPGALNEAYSDIFGETIDRINARGNNDPGGPRSPEGENCSAHQIFPPETRVNAPASIAADYPSGTSAFSPIITAANTVTADVVRPDDGSGASLTDGCCGTAGVCEPGSWTNAADIVGKIVLIDRGGVCGAAGFATKALNAQRHGAIGVIIANVAGSANPAVAPNMGGVSPAEAVTIPAASMNLANGDLLRTALVGETVNATLQPNTPGALDDSNRWLMGEDVNATGLVGALRDMYRPTCFGDPGKVTDVEYTCGAGDNGGVHSNSGVPNHAYALIVDGGSYNGQAIAGLGLTKAAHIYFRAASVYQGPASDFADHADAIEQSCSDLIGVDLADLLTGAPSGNVISAGDCAEVAKAMLAVEMRTPPSQCNFQPILAKNPPDRCEAGTAQANVLFDDFETDPIGAWTVTHSSSSPDFTPRDWVWSSELPDRDGSALFGINFPGGTCAPGGDESGVIHAASPVITLPPGAANPRLTFDHWIATETRWDGGNVKISVNGGPWQVVAPADFTYNAYNSTLFTAAAGNTNPMAGEPAFTGTDAGSVEGSWGRSHVNLAPYAGPGDTVQLRLDMGNDGCTGFFGWYVDDPTVYACVPADPPLIYIADTSVIEGNSGFSTADFTVQLSHPSAKPVQFWYITLFGTALPFLDFVPAIGSVTIDPLQLEGHVRVKVVGDRLRERDETFFVALFAATGGIIVEDDEARGRIINDDGGGR